MKSMPMPELIAVLVIWLVIFGLRMLIRSRHRRVPTATAIATTREAIDNERQRARLVASCAIIVLVSIPLILQVVPPNGSYGFRTGFTRSSPAIWYAANAFMGWALVVAAVVSTVLLVVLPTTVKRWLLWVAFLAPIAGAITASLLYLKRLG